MCYRRQFLTKAQSKRRQAQVRTPSEAVSRSIANLRAYAFACAAYAISSTVFHWLRLYGA
jgi:hypothetical protein